MLLSSPGISLHYLKLYSTAFLHPSLHCFNRITPCQINQEKEKKFRQSGIPMVFQIFFCQSVSWTSGVFSSYLFDQKMNTIGPRNYHRLAYQSAINKISVPVKMEGPTPGSQAFLDFAILFISLSLVCILLSQTWIISRKEKKMWRMTIPLKWTQHSKRG